MQWKKRADTIHSVGEERFMKKSALAIACVGVLLLGGCGLSGERGESTAVSAQTDRAKVTLEVTTTWAGSDGGSATYQKYINEYVKETGNLINDKSGGSDENFKQRVIADFEVGAEPDVLHYFTGMDAGSFINAGKVVSLKTIRGVYPEYASNMRDEFFEDDDSYAIPTYGFWEGMYVNKKVCQRAGVAVPDANTTWEEFLEICDQVKRRGYTPIAVSLAKEPHYWFEYVIYNQMSPDSHMTIPLSLEDKAGQAWLQGLQDLKELYEKEYISENALSTSADEILQEFLEGKAAFLVEGSWKLGTILTRTENVDDFGVTYVPGKGDRKSTDIIGGFSSGWYITKKAWDDPDKREAAVQFIMFMTRDEVISEFASVALSPTALKKETHFDTTGFCQLQKEAIEMLENRTSMVPAVQDSLSLESKAPFLDRMCDIVTERVTIEASVIKFLSVRQEEAKELAERK